MTLRAPFPWFGGKSRAAHLVWAAFGDVPNYVEPFAGSLAVLLGRPTAPRIETVNDIDCYLSNFWRAVQSAPEEVAKYADWPVNEADLHARHRWLVAQEEFRHRMKHEPDYFSAQVAGWWVWGICQWIGGGWCAAPEWEGRTNAGLRVRGIFTANEERRPNIHFGNDIHRVALDEHVHEKRPHLWRGGVGVHRRMRDITGSSEWEKRPVFGRGGLGVHTTEQIPHLSGDSGAAGRGIHASGRTNGPILDWMTKLQARLRRVRVCCGDWSRVLGPSATDKIGITAVMLDPPYSADADRDPSLYAHDDLQVAHRVREWALENGNNPRLRIALCGYEGEHDMPEAWTCVPWKASGGYAASAGNHENAKRERIWFSPHCDVARKQASLFAEEVA